APFLRRPDGRANRGGAGHVAALGGLALGVCPRVVLREDAARAVTPLRTCLPRLPCPPAHRPLHVLQENHGSHGTDGSHGLNEGEMFGAAVQIADPTERAAWLDQACADNTELRQRVEALLKAYEQAGSFMQQAGAEPRGTADLSKAKPPASGEPNERPGVLIG